MKPDETIIDGRTMWCHLSSIAGSTPHWLVNLKRNVDFPGNMSLVYGRLAPSLLFHYAILVFVLVAIICLMYRR